MVNDGDIDLLIEKDLKILKVQVKAFSDYKKNYVDLRKSSSKSKNIYSENEIDYFAIVDVNTAEVYLLKNSSLEVKGICKEKVEEYSIKIYPLIDKGDITDTKNIKAWRHIRPVKASSEFKGVSWNKEKKKWRAGITVLGKYKHIGYYGKEEEAARAYDETVKELFGNENVYLNFG